MKQIMLYITLLVLLCTLGFTQDTMTMPDGTVMSTATMSSGVNYTFSENYQLADNQSNCVTRNCLILTNTGSGGGTVSFVQVSSGFDGSVYAIDGVGNVWTLPFSTTTKALWTKVTAMGSGFTSIAVRSSTEIYALYSNPALCSSGNPIALWNGTSWRSISTYNNGCGFTLSITNDGALYALGGDHALWYTTTPNAPNWIRVGTNTYTNAVGYTNNIAFANSGTVLYMVNTTTGVSTAVSGAPAVSNTPNNMAVTSDGYLFVRSNTSTTKGNLWVDTLTDGAAPWSNVMGTVSILGGNVRDLLFAQNSSGYLYHYLNTAVSHTSHMYGNFDCAVFGGTCPTGSLHTAYASGRFLHGTNTAAYAASPAVVPSTTVNVFYTDVSYACDPLFGDPNSSDCWVSQTTTTTNNHVQCSVMGLIYSGVFNLPSLLKVEAAFTRVYNTLAGAQNCFTSSKTGKTYCNYPVDNWCSNTATPDLDLHNGLVMDIAGAYSYWDMHAMCVSILGTSWHCTHAFGKGIGGGLPNPSPNCTYNPR